MTGPARAAALVAALVVIGLGAGWILTLPAVVPASALPPHTPDLENGRVMFDIGGCASCHAVPNDDPEKIDRLRLGGGLAIKSAFGTFFVPNISSDPKDGIGSWSEANFVTALWKGTSEHGNNLYPVFPYTSYHLMALNDVRDLFAYLRTLPPVSRPSRRHELAFPYDERRLVGGWKLLFLRDGPYVPDPSQTAQWNRGAYLANGPGHCAECHSPRNALGGIIERQRYAGGPTPDGESWVPNITGLSTRSRAPWSLADLAHLLEDGMTPSGDFVGGGMNEVIRNTSRLSVDDRTAIAAYIASLPPVQGPTPPSKKN